MQHNGTTYIPTWQTWHMVRHKSRPTQDACEDTVTMSGQATRQVTRQAMRERVQIARIDQRMTVSDLADQVGCDVDTIVAFEGGDEILSNDLQKKIRSVLRIE